MTHVNGNPVSVFLEVSRKVYARCLVLYPNEFRGEFGAEMVEVFDEQGKAHTAWAGNDPTKDLNYLIVKLPKTTYRTDRVKVTLATNVVSGWNEIDAVQLIGTDQ